DLAVCGLAPELQGQYGIKRENIFHVVGHDCIDILGAYCREPGIIKLGNGSLGAAVFQMGTHACLLTGGKTVQRRLGTKSATQGCAATEVPVRRMYLF